MLSENKVSKISKLPNDDELYKLYRKAKANHEKNKLDKKLEESLIDAYKAMIVTWSKKRDTLIKKFRETKNIDLYHKCADLNDRILETIAEDGYEINKTYYSFSEESNHNADAKKIKDELVTIKQSTSNFILKTIAEFSKQRDKLIGKLRSSKDISFYQECFALNNKIIAIIKEVNCHHSDYAKVQVYSEQAQKISIDLDNVVKSTPQLILDPVKKFIEKHTQIEQADDCKKPALLSAIESGDCYKIKSIIRQKLFGIDETQEDLKVNQLLEGQKVNLNIYFSLLNKENTNELVFNLVVFACFKLDKPERNNNWRVAQLVIDSLKENDFLLEKDFGVMAVNTSKIALSNFEKMLYEISKLSIHCESQVAIKKSKKKIISAANKFLPVTKADSNFIELENHEKKDDLDDKLKEPVVFAKHKESKVEKPESKIQNPEELAHESMKIFSKTIASIVKPLNKMITGGRFSEAYINKTEAKIFLIVNNENSIMFLHKGQYKLLEKSVLIRKLAALLKEMKFDIIFEFRTSEIMFKSPKELSTDQVTKITDKIVKNQMKKNKNYDRFGSKATVSVLPSALFFSTSTRPVVYQVSDISHDFDEDMQRGFMAYDEEKMKSMPGVSKILS